MTQHGIQHWGWKKKITEDWRVILEIPDSLELCTITN